MNRHIRIAIQTLRFIRYGMPFQRAFQYARVLNSKELHNLMKGLSS